MNLTFEILIPALLGLIIFSGYSIVVVFRMRYGDHEEGTNWSKRIEKVLMNSGETGDKTPLALIKENAASEAFFKSKLPKIEGYKEWLMHAGLEVSPAIFCIGCVLIGLTIGLIFLLILHTSLFFSFLICVANTFLLPWAGVTYLTKRRRNQFLEEFPNALDMVRRALRSGHSAERALEMVAEQSRGLVGEAFRTITDKMRLGESIETILADMSNRIGIDDFRMLSIVIVLQRETGGSLAEATENFAKIIRARQNLRKKMKALTAEGRTSAIILTAIPFFVLGTLYVTTPAYLDSLLYTPTGQMVLTIGGLMVVIGIAVILRMVYKEIY